MSEHTAVFPERSRCESAQIEVVRAGMDTWMVDPGRPGFREQGVGPGGPADRFSFDLAHGFLNNAPDQAMIEFSLIGPTLICRGGPVVAVFTGAVEGGLLEGQPIPPEKTFLWRPGQTLKTGPMHRGARGYLALAGGFSNPPILGSRSGFRPLQTGEVLSGFSTKAPLRRLKERVWQPPHGVLRFLPGPEAERFDPKNLLDQTWTLSHQANRMGIRLEGIPFVRTDNREMLSEPVLPGTIQINHAGLPMILGVAAQTIGGYPRLGMVIRADQDAMGQLRPGDRVRFEQVNLDEALGALEATNALRNQWLHRLRAGTPPIG